MKMSIFLPYLTTVSLTTCPNKFAKCVSPWCTTSFALGNSRVAKIPTSVKGWTSAYNLLLTARGPDEIPVGNEEPGSINDKLRVL
jgi:hypothetical protein